MGNPKGFMTIKRVENGYRPINERIRDFAEVEIQLPETARKLQDIDKQLAYIREESELGERY